VFKSRYASPVHCMRCGMERSAHRTSKAHRHTRNGLYAAARMDACLNCIVQVRVIRVAGGRGEKLLLRTLEQHHTSLVLLRA
jgi:hypothetical protein